MTEEKEKLCKYCGQNKAVKTILNPNTWEDSEDFWDVCATCAEVIDNQMKLSIGAIIADKPHGKKIGNKMKKEAIKRLKEISYEADVPIISIEFEKDKKEKKWKVKNN